MEVQDFDLSTDLRIVIVILHYDFGLLMIVDTFSGLPDRRVLGSWLNAFVPFNGYVRLFAEKIAPSMGSTVDEVLKQMSTDGPEAVTERMLDALESTFMPIEQYVRALDALNVRAQGIWFHILPDSPPESQGAFIAAIEAKKAYPDRFFLLPSFILSDDTPKQVEEMHRQHGLAGVVTLAILDRILPDDPRYFPLYETMTNLGLVLWNHTVNSWAESRESEYGHPRYVDRIACAFPNLKIVMGHGGWPWVLEALTVARRQPNVWLEPSSHRWKHLAKAGSGWESLMYYGNWIGADKILFGSLWQLQGLPLSVVIDEVKQLPLSDKNREKWLFKNADRLYGPFADLGKKE